jgi:hypothetical protein
MRSAIEDYALLGDTHGGGLVGREASMPISSAWSTATPRPTLPAS